ncbi:ABC transporter substrate-binding protein [Paenibacillus alginolyticus]|uniref:ABC transporter substrate-binding protein n=1 Tax=Paenibacillus alginolyticus TaxID=59839 RepID=A0ABT4GCH4_9BACL|nr:ABC transporter substrate-binding protein [Paenibacillus alginolyticus]MCY9693898.1 ABC transporter substrate-binding protein [Paenibacillus alginolyticus]MEC0145150.1 ABC transporter substrate-binding protein [Paenibacillus alginolyticus]
MLKKKALVSFVLSAALMVVAGCGQKAAPAPAASAAASATPAATAAAQKSYKVAISQIVEHPSLDATRQGFLAALKDGGIVEGTNLKVDFNNAQGDPANNLSIAQKIASSDADLVLGIATPSALAVVQQVKKAPILFAAVTDPLAAKIVTDLDKPGGNVSGASDTNPMAVAQLMDFVAANLPKVKTVGLVINEGEPNAVIMAKNAEQTLTKHGIKLIKAPVTNTSEVKQAAQSLVGRADAFLITLDNTVVSGVDGIIQIANEKHIPFFSSDRDTVEKGAFATVGFKYYDHGYQVGQMAVDILKNGKKTADMKVTVPEKMDLILNLKAAKAQGIDVTDAMKNAVKDKEKNIIQ